MSTPVITITNLTHRFGDHLAIDDLTLDVRSGEVFGFLGHNGAGKTTTIRLLNGLLTPSSGEMQVLGLNPLRNGPALRARTGVLTETPSLDERLSPYDNLSIFADLMGSRDLKWGSGWKNS
jgi:ABC-2 type transport system ATP-binding protein